MRKMAIFIILLYSVSSIKAQDTCSFENLNLGVESYWDGSDLSGGFSSGSAWFPNVYDTAWGGYWSSGWIYSSLTDSSTAGNLHSASSGGGKSSATYAVGTAYTPVHVLPGSGNAVNVHGLYVTNSTYSYISMRDGDVYGKQFGDSTDANGVDDGTNGEDWYSLYIEGYKDGVSTGNLTYYLADFRFADDNSDYILNSWDWVDLNSLGLIDSLTFLLNSSDVSMWGMNTPAFFAIDGMTTSGLTSINENSLNHTDFNFYPNPCSGKLQLSSSNNESQMTLIDQLGRVAFTRSMVQNNEVINLEHLSSGIYTLVVNGDHFSSRKLIISK